MISILVRPYNWSGVISFIGKTQFAAGKWIGVSLDAPTGKFYRCCVIHMCLSSLYRYY